MDTPRRIDTNTKMRDHLVDLIESSQRRILLETMSFEHAGKMSPIVEAMSQAALRGVNVSVIYDRYSYFDAFTKRGLEGYRDLEKSVKTLSSRAIKFTALGRRHINPFARRHHAKAFIFDQTTITAGGANLTDDTFDHYDYMFEFNNPGIADILYERLPILAALRQNATIPLNEQGKIIIDGGAPNSSPILEAAIDLAQDAEKIWYSSKMLPHPHLAEDILEAPEQYCYYGHADRGGRFNRTAIRRDHPRAPLNNLYDGDRTLHAKFIVAEYADGNRRAITGSHNFNQRGVKWGTQELALDTTDPSVCDQLIDFAENLPQKPA